MQQVYLSKNPAKRCVAIIAELLKHFEETGQYYKMVSKQNK